MKLNRSQHERRDSLLSTECIQIDWLIEKQNLFFFFFWREDSQTERDLSFCHWRTNSLIEFLLFPGFPLDPLTHSQIPANFAREKSFLLLPASISIIAIRVVSSSFVSFLFPFRGLFSVSTNRTEELRRLETSENSKRTNSLSFFL